MALARKRAILIDKDISTALNNYNIARPFNTK